jgi:hypothetical protein
MKPYSLIRRNPFVYPGGQPAFDPAHPAANMMLGAGFVSAVAINGAPTNVKTGQINSSVGAGGSVPGAGTINGLVGPNINIASTTYRSLNFSTTTWSGGAFNFAVITAFTDLTNQGGVLGNNTNNVGSGVFLVMRFGGFGINISNTGNNFLGPGLVVNVPYFCVVSGICNNAASDFFNYAVTRLDNGQVFSGRVATGAKAFVTAANPAVSIGAFGPQPQLASAWAYSDGPVIPLPACQQWAVQPWSFWYQQLDPFAFAQLSAGDVLGPSTPMLFM